MSATNRQQKGASTEDDEQTTLWTYGQQAAERAEDDWLPRTGKCDCGGTDSSCFRCIDWERLESRNDEVLDR